MDLRFNQETLKMVESMGHLLKLETDSDDIYLLSSAFDLDAANLETEIRLLKQSSDLPESSKANSEKWMSWLTIPGTNREVIFCNIYNALKSWSFL